METFPRRYVYKSPLRKMLVFCTQSPSTPSSSYLPICIQKLGLFINRDVLRALLSLAGGRGGLCWPLGIQIQCSLGRKDTPSLHTHRLTQHTYMYPHTQLTQTWECSIGSRSFCKWYTRRVKMRSVCDEPYPSSLIMAR